MRLNLLVSPHSKGLLRDADVIQRALIGNTRALATTMLWRAGDGPFGAARELLGILKCRIRPFDANIHVEDLKSRWMRAARKNLWIPNQEWVRPQSAATMSSVDVALCKTRVAVEAFSSVGLNTLFTGFTSPDSFDASVAKELRALHVAGSSPNKGTRVVLEAWRKNPQWPELDLVWSVPEALESGLPPNVKLYGGQVSDPQMRMLQNRATVHVCPSSVEGFGHTIVEAMSCGACVVTTDAPPMNELVDATRGVLVPWDRKEEIGLATAYHVSVDGLTSSLRSVFATDLQELALLGERARDWYLDNDQQFLARFRTEVVSSIRGL